MYKTTLPKKNYSLYYYSMTSCVECDLSKSAYKSIRHKKQTGGKI